MKAIAVTTLARSNALPDVPPVADTLNGFAIDTWWGLVAPAATPKEVVAKLNTGVTNANYGDTYRGDVTVDPRGNIYIASVTASFDFPTAAAFQAASGGGNDGVVCKLTPALTGLTWSNYLGGSGEDIAYSVALDSVNNVFVSGGTSSPNFPGVAGGFRAASA